MFTEQNMAQGEPPAPEGEETFECAWCKEAGLKPKEYIRPIEELGGRDEEGRPICQECVDEAVSEYYVDEAVSEYDDDDDDWEVYDFDDDDWEVYDLDD